MKKDNPELYAFSDLERPHAVRLGELWSDFIRVADEARDPHAAGKASARESEVAAKATHAIPLLDDMKGILQWD